MNDRSLFVADVGNTRTKFGFYARPNAELEPPVEFADESENYERLARRLKDLKAPRARWIVASVCPQKVERLERLVRELRPDDVFRVLELSDVKIGVEYRYPKKLGLDRVVAAFSATRFLPNARPILIVDVGTAATVDLVDARGVFCGGAILAGSRIMSESLYEKTEQLPELNDAERKCDAQEFAYPAQETEEAILLGVDRMLSGAIASIYWEVKRSLAQDAEKLAIVISGGNATSIERGLNRFFSDLQASLGAPVPRPQICVLPNLILDGLRYIAQTQEESFWRRTR